MAPGAPPLHCPFCQQPESERVAVQGKLMVVFPCMFSPLFDAPVEEDRLQSMLDERYGQESGYFRRQCDRLHARMTINGISG